MTENQADHPVQADDPAASREQTEPVRAPASLADSKYLSLTTFRKTGVPVATPVWFVADGAHLLLWTGAESGKVKRLRHTSRVTVAPCDARGELGGDPVSAQARIMSDDEMPRVVAAMRRRYPVSFRGFHAVTTLSRALGLRRARAGQVGVEITLD
ncbi:MAG TPA: PPOX class F420-dependent oxidoreductase [Cryptosporangiaceae bacterium]|nr:PPOX class F420-dependent oxidoreductase [Cryptosporangiaceae bacterium]